MANRSFTPGLGCLDKGMVHVFGNFTTGAAGAIASFGGLGITSVTKLTNPGEYRITLQDTYQSLLAFSQSAELAAGPAINYGFYVQASTVGTGVLDIRFVDATGAGVLPVTGIKYRFNITLSNSTAR